MQRSLPEFFIFYSPTCDASFRQGIITAAPSTESLLIGGEGLVRPLERKGRYTGL